MWCTALVMGMRLCTIIVNSNYWNLKEYKNMINVNILKHYWEKIDRKRC